MPRQCARQHRARLALVLGHEHLDEPLDGVDCADRGHAGDHQMAHLGSLQQGPGHVDVAHLGHHDHVGVLAQRVLDRRDRARGVGPDFALVDDRLLVGVQHLDRFLDRDDVAFARRVQVVDHGREGRSLARASEPGHEHESLGVPDQVGHRGRQPERLEARDAREDPTQHQAGPAALAERAGPEAAQPRDAVHEVCLVGVGEHLGAGLGHDRGDHTLGVRGLHRVERRLPETAVDAQARSRAHLHVHVGCAVFHGESQQPVEIQHLRASSLACIGRPRATL